MGRMDRKSRQEPAWKRRRREAAEAAQRVRDLELREQTLQVEIARGSRTERREIRNTRLNLAGVVTGAIGVVVGAIGVATWLAEQPDREEERAVRRATLVNNAYQVIADNVAASPHYLVLTPQLHQAINTLLWYREPVWIQADFIEFQKPDFLCGDITLEGRDGVILTDVRAESVNLFVRGRFVLIDGWDSRKAYLEVSAPYAEEMRGVAAVVGYFDDSEIQFLHQGVLSVSARSTAVQTFDGHAFLDNYKGQFGEFGFDNAAGLAAYLPQRGNRAPPIDYTRAPEFWRGDRIAELLQHAWSMHVLEPADPPAVLPPTDEGGAWGSGVPSPQFEAACPNRHCDNGGFEPFKWDRPMPYQCNAKRREFVPLPAAVRNRRWVFDGSASETPAELDPIARSRQGSTGPARPDPAGPSARQ
jgi:hypothetical protein